MAYLEEKNLISLREAVNYCSYSQEYLSLRARNGKLKSIKIGRAWMTTREWLDEYIGRVEKYKEELDKKHNNKINLSSVVVEKVSAKKIAPPIELPTIESDYEKKELVFNEFPSYCYKPKKSFLNFSLLYFFALIAVSISMVFSQPIFNSVSNDAMGAAVFTGSAVDVILDLGANSLLAVIKDSDMLISQLKSASPLIDYTLYGLGYSSKVFSEYLSWMAESASNIFSRLYFSGVSMESNLLYISLDILERIAR